MKVAIAVRIVQVFVNIVLVLHVYVVVLNSFPCLFIDGLYLSIRRPDGDHTLFGIICVYMDCRPHLATI